MAFAKKRTPQVEQLRSYLEGVGKNLTDKRYGPAGLPWGTQLTELEALLLEIREILTEKMLAEALSRQAATHPQRPPAYRCCPGCQEPLACTEQTPRLVVTETGEAQWSEPEGYCRRCRQAFFPAEPEPGDRPQSL